MRLKPAIIIFSLLLLTACGNKGALFLPQSELPESEQPSDKPELQAEAEQ